MEQKEYDALMKQIKREQEEVRNSKEAAKKYLIELGILTPKGNLKKNIKTLGYVFDQARANTWFSCL